MADFEIPGIGKARMKLTELSRNPTGKSRGGHRKGAGRKGKKQEVEPNADR